MAKLKKSHRKLKIFRASLALLWFLIIGLISFRVAFSTDYHLQFSLLGRIILMSLLGGVTVLSFLYFLKICLEPFSAEKTALVLEKRFPSLGDSLISAVQLSQKKSPYVSESLIQATIDRARKLSLQLSLKKILPLLTFFKVFLFALVVVAASSVPYFLGRETQSQYRIFWQRCVEFQEVSWPKEVVLEVNFTGEFLRKIGPRHYSLPEGASVVISAQIDRGDPEKVELISPQKNPPLQMALERASSKSHFIRLTPQRTLEFFLLGGDFKSPLYKISVQPYPTLSIRYQRQYPSYLGIPDDTEWYSWSNIEIWWGTEIRFEGTTNKAVHSAQIKINGDVYGGKGLEILPQKDGTSLLRGRFLALRGKLMPLGMDLKSRGTPKEGAKKDPSKNQNKFYFSFLLVDKDGMANPSPQEFEITARRDLPPGVRITSPGQPLEITPQGEFDLQFFVQDDFAIEEVKVMLDIFSGKKKVFSLVSALTMEKKGQKESHFHLTFRAEDITKDNQSLAVGHRIEVRVQAKDFKNIGSPNIGLSPETVEISVVEANKILIQFKRILDEAEVRLRETMQDQTLSRRVLRKVALSRKFLEGKPTLEDLEHISSAQNIQHAVTRGLGESRSLIQKALQLVEKNQIKGEEERLPVLKKVEEALGNLNGKDSPSISRELSALLNSPKREHLDMARELQEKVIQSLEDILGKLNKWGGFEEIIQDIRDLQQGQETILKKTQELIKKK